MHLEAISLLEKLCEAPLPASCRAVLMDYPEALRGAVRADDGSDSEGLVSQAELLADPGDVLRINREVRVETVSDPEGREFCWPTHFLVIGETGDGDYYCVDVAGKHEGVLQFRHRSVEFETVADSVNEFIELLVECFVTGIDDLDEDELDDDDEYDNDDDPDGDSDAEEPE